MNALWPSLLLAFASLPEMSYLLPLSTYKARVEDIAGCKFNSCLLNFYRSGDDHLSWHSDNEPEYGENPTIASVSFGAARDFLLRKNIDKSRRHSFLLDSGDILMMMGSIQKHWMHCVPKRKRITESRVNLTFRQVLNSNFDKQDTDSI